MSNVIYIESLDRVAEFISLTNKEYFDVFLSKDNALFITNSVEVFGSLKLRARCDEEISFRLDRALFGRLAVEGLVKVENGDDVKLTFCTAEGNELYSMSCAKQITYSGDYEEKIKLLTGITRDMYINIGRFVIYADFAESTNRLSLLAMGSHVFMLMVMVVSIRRLSVQRVML